MRFAPDQSQKTQRRVLRFAEIEEFGYWPDLNRWIVQVYESPIFDQLLGLSEAKIAQKRKLIHGHFS